MALDVNQLGSALGAAAQGAFGQSWSNIKNYLLPELMKIAQTLVDIERGLLANPPFYSQESAKVLFRMQLRASQMVLTAAVGMQLRIIEDGINAALKAVSDTVNTAIGFPLIAA